MYDHLVDAVRGRITVIYNQAFDVTIIDDACDTFRLPHLWKGWGWWGCEPMFPEFFTRATFPGIARRAECAMLAYSEWVGEERRRGEYRWQPLPYGDHSALGDSLAALHCIEDMAASPTLEAVLAERTAAQQSVASLVAVATTGHECDETISGEQG